MRRGSMMKDILDRPEAVSVEQALRILDELGPAVTPAEVLPIEEAYGRVLSSDLLSPEDLPGFNRSTMDGYAVHSADTFGASETMPVYLKVRGEVRMGKRPDFSLKRSEAAAIPTGGMLPDGADAVVMVEHTNRVSTEMIEVMKTVAPNENVILAGEDVRKGEVVLRRGRRLRPQDVAALAGVGVVEVEVHRRPLVAVISTGDEVVPAEGAVSAGEVRDMNSYNLSGLVLRCGGIPVRKGIVRDHPDQLRKALAESLQEAEMVLLTGGSSVGTEDHTARVMEELGPPGILFHGAGIKPGKPLIAAASGGIPLFGLPGHPAAVTVCFETFVEPVLRRISGERGKAYLPSRRTVKAFFGRSLHSSPGREDHIRVSLRKRDEVLWAVPVLGKSGLIRTLVEADGVVVIPPNRTGLYEGEEVEVRLFNE